jgi:hypothetical protein
LIELVGIKFGVSSGEVEFVVVDIVGLWGKGVCIANDIAC